MKAAPLAPPTGSEASPADPVAPKKPCPDFEAGFLHIESTAEFAGIHDAVKALASEQSIYNDLTAPQAVLDKEEFQYVNLPPATDALRDKIPARDGDEVFRADRMGNAPRILVRFTEKKKFKFKIELTPAASNLNYYDTEIPRNPKFKQELSDPAKIYETNDSGYLIVEDLTLNAAGGNSFTITVEATDAEFAGVGPKNFDKGKIKTARYLWMLPVIGGDNTKWVPTNNHPTCMSRTISMYHADAYIHINNSRFKAQSCADAEFIENADYTWDKQKALFQSFLANAQDINDKPYPKEMHNYIFISLMIRFIYERTKLKTSALIAMDGAKHEIDLIEGVVEPVPKHGKPYLISSTGYCIDYKNLNIETIRLEDRTIAIDGYGKDRVLRRNGHIGCQRFEVDTAGLPNKGLMLVVVQFYGLNKTVAAGSHWGNATHNQQSGFYFFAGQTYHNNAIHNSSLPVIHCVSSHELGHAVQMTTKGNSTKPNTIVSYYDNDGAASFGQRNNETKNHKGPHCRTGFIPASEATPTEPATAGGTCVMYGQANIVNQRFCSERDPDKQNAMITDKKNDCTMAVRKVSLDEPFSAYR